VCLCDLTWCIYFIRCWFHWLTDVDFLCWCITGLEDMLFKMRMEHRLQRLQFMVRFVAA
jgi:hypothetical protein